MNDWLTDRKKERLNGSSKDQSLDCSGVQRVFDSRGQRGSWMPGAGQIPKISVVVKKIWIYPKKSRFLKKKLPFVFKNLWRPSFIFRHLKIFKCFPQFFEFFHNFFQFLSQNFWRPFLVVYLNFYENWDVGYTQAGCPGPSHLPLHPPLHPPLHATTRPVIKSIIDCILASSYYLKAKTKIISYVRSDRRRIQFYILSCGH